MIETIVSTFNLLANRNQSQYFPASDIMEALDLAQLDLFNKEYQKFESNQTISDILEPFYATVTLAITNGVSASLPTDIHRILSVRNTANEKDVDQIKQGSWTFRKDNKLYAPTDEFPIFRYSPRGSSSDPKTIDVFPVSVSSVEFEYLRRPTTPVYAVNLSSDGRTEIYDAGSSTDLEWSDTVLSELIHGTAVYLGVSLKDAELVSLQQLRPPTDAQ